MEAEERRIEILNLLSSAEKPIKGMKLADKLDVSRQVIVQDIALLRASGMEIIATPQGYIMIKSNGNKLIKTIVCKHLGYDEIRDELNIIVDNGGKVIDVIVEHPLYGEIKSPLMINSRLDVEDFMNSLIKTKAEPLSSLTDGVHIHSIEVEDERAFEKIKSALNEKKYLILNK